MDYASLEEAYVLMSEAVKEHHLGRIRQTVKYVFLFYRT